MDKYKMICEVLGLEEDLFLRKGKADFSAKPKRVEKIEKLVKVNNGKIKK